MYFPFWPRIDDQKVHSFRLATDRWPKTHPSFLKCFLTILNLSLVAVLGSGIEPRFYPAAYHWVYGKTNDYLNFPLTISL